jgi:methylglutaconyl-CoA hydratase
VLILDSKIDKVFCAGADLKERATMTTDQVQLFVSELRQTFTDLESLPIPTVSVINGVY